MNLHRGLLFWGLALIVGGATALAVQQGYVDEDLVANAWRLWPLILVAIGLSIILARTPFAVLGTITAAVVIGIAGGALISVGPIAAGCTGDEPTAMHARSGIFGSAATVDLRFDCGTLEVATVPGNEWTVSSGRVGGGGVHLTSDSDRLEVTSEDDRGWWKAGKQRWEVSLPRVPHLVLVISPNAADSRVDLAGGTFDSVTLSPNAGSVILDLRGAQVGTLTVSLNAGSTAIFAGSHQSMTGTLSVNAGSIELCTDPGTALRLVVSSSVAFSHNLEGSGMLRSGDTWSTAGYADAVQRIELQVSGNAGSFELNPVGGCS